MKKFIFLLTLLIIVYSLFNITPNTNALTATPTPEATSSTTDTIDQQINDLKTRIASRVAQLKLVEKRGIIAKVTDLSDTQITVSDLEQNNKFIDVDELTRFSSPDTNESFGISDIAKNTYIGVLGLYNKESRRILARFVNVIYLPQIIHGAVNSIDTKNFIVAVTTDDGKKVNLDIETTTKTFSYFKSEGMIRTGFSKINENDRIIALVKPNPEKNRTSALKITLLPEIPKDPNTIDATKQKEIQSSPNNK